MSSLSVPITGSRLLISVSCLTERGVFFETSSLINLRVVLFFVFVTGGGSGEWGE